MRSFSSLFVIFAIFVSALSPALGQRARMAERAAKRTERPTVVPEKRGTRFDAVESFSEGNGAYIRWRMGEEVANAGFYVYRMGRFGGRIVSEMLPGAAFRYGNDPVAGQAYNYFDPEGTMGAAYFIEAVGMNDIRFASPAATTNYVYDIESLDGGSELKSADLRLGAEPAKLKNELTVDSELRREIASGEVLPDPVKHRQVVAQPGVRIGVRSGGLIRVPKADLASAGFDVNGDHTNWQLYMEGVERPMIIGPNADYIEFFGKKLDTVESDTRMYYLIAGASPGRRIQSAVLRRGLTNLAAKKYNQTFSMTEKRFYLEQVLNGDAENFWGRILNTQGTNVVIDLSGIDRTPGNRTMNLSIKGFTNGSHNVSVTLNGTALAPLQGINGQIMSRTYSIPVELLIDGANTIRFQTASGICLFEKVSIDFPRNYVAQGNKLDFYNDNYRRAVVSGFASSDIRLFDVTSEADPKLMSNVDIVQTNGTWGPVIPSGRSRVFTAVDGTAVSPPFSVTPNIPEIIGDPALGANLVIITHKNFLNEAQTWANYRIGQGFTVKVVQVEEIFDEFGYGVSSSAAVRDFLSYAYSSWATPPSYVLLIGDASFDPRNYLNFGYWNMVPTEMVDTLYEETGSDEALADFNNDGLAEIPIGRISARTNAAISTVYNKTVQFEASVTPSILDRGALFAYDQNVGYEFDQMSDRIMAMLPAAMPKIEVQHATNSYTTVVNAFNDGDPTPANSGILVANYTGHGSSAAWRDSNLFDRSRIPLLTNATNPSLVTALTCLNGYFVVPDSAESLAEAMTTATNGGAVAMWASTGKTTPDVQEIMAKRFYLKFGDGSITRLGNLVNDAKSALPAGTDVRRSWALFGDPMLKVR